MNFKRNFADELVVPSFILTKASGERIGVLSCTEKTYKKSLNAPDEITFTSYLYEDDIENPYYNRLENLQYIEVPDYGRFVIQNVEEHNEGTRLAYKNVTCKDTSVLLSQRSLELFNINVGDTISIDGVKFYDMGDTAHSLLNLVIDELFPAWNIGHVDAILASKQRSFEVSKQDVYSFLMKDISEAFECTFLFDSASYTINAYANENVGEDCNIHVSFNNLLKNTNISCDTDNIKTCMVLTGQDDLTIREVARGNDRIYNFDYYCSPTFWSQSLYNAYNAWQNLVYHTPVDWVFLRDDLKDEEGNPYFVFDDQKVDDEYVLNFEDAQAKYQEFITANELEDNYNNLYTYLLARYQNYYTDVAEWTSTRIPAGNNVRYFGYGTYPIGYPNNVDPESEDTFKIERYKEVVELKETDTLPKEPNEDTLYIQAFEKTDDKGEKYYEYKMWRYYNAKWIDTNIWTGIAKNALDEKLKSAEQNQSTAMKNGYGTRTVDTKDKPTEDEKKRQEANYIKYYLPYYASVCQLNLELVNVQGTIDIYTACQERLHNAMSGISYLTDMKTNFTVPQLTELSKWIREDELNSSNYLVTDIMTEEERFEMLNQLLSYGSNELEKVSQPQFSFSADMVNLLAMPEFDKYSGYFDIGNYIHVSFRDDYDVKATLTEMKINFYKPDDFNVTFGNTFRKTNQGVITDIADMAKEAHSMASSVSFNKSYWTQQSKNADVISTQLADGLLEAGNFLRSGIHSEFLVDDRGVFVTTVSDDPNDPNYQYAKTSDSDTSYDSIYIGGGRVLFTDDGWKTVKMSVGRGMVSLPSMQNNKLVFTDTSKFGVFADFVIAGYVAGSTIVGGNIYSPNYQTSSVTNVGNYGAHINLNDGTFEFNNNKGKKRLVLDDSGLRAYGTIYATKGHIGCDDDGKYGFVIESVKTDNGTMLGRLYNGKPTLNSTSEGVYVGTDGISLGKHSGTVAFRVGKDGTLRAVKGKIGGCSLDTDRIYSDKWQIQNNGYAEFSYVKITGVQSGSRFGEMGYDGGGYNFGTFAGGSYFKSNASNPFGGEESTTYSTIGTIAVNKVQAAIVEAGSVITQKLDARYVTADKLNSSDVKINGKTTVWRNLKFGEGIYYDVLCGANSS